VKITANFQKGRQLITTAKIKMKTLNPYKITWLVLTPNAGKATKKDLKILNGKRFGFGISNNEIKDCFANKELALNFAQRIVGLTKHYKVTFITDKQFGLSKWDESLLNVATTKQKLESFNI
jgi:hypothetical protein